MVGPFLHHPDDWRRHRLTYRQLAVNEIHAVGMTGLNNADFPWLFGNCLLETEVTTGTTAMAELRKNEDVLREHGNSMVSADLSTLAAVSAPLLIYPGNQNRDGLSSGNDWLQKEMVIGLLDIAVKKLYPPPIFERKGKAGSHQRLAGSPFTAGNRDNHLYSLTIPVPHLGHFRL